MDASTVVLGNLIVVLDAVSGTPESGICPKCGGMLHDTPLWTVSLPIH